VKLGDNITQEQATEYLQHDVEKLANKVKALVKSSVNDNQFGAITSFAYNVGTGNLAKSTLLKKVNANPADKLIVDEFMKWNKARVAGKLVELKGLTRRRVAESNLYYDNN
jgi:lysozyme